MRPVLLAAALALSLHAEGPLFQQSRFDAADGQTPAGWKAWAPRGEIAPKAFLDLIHDRGEGGALALAGGSNPAVCGAWERLVTPVEEGRWYRLKAWYRGEGLDYPPVQVLARLDWANAQGARTDHPEYASIARPSGEWTELQLEAVAPKGASGVRIQLMLLNAPRATVWWDDVTLEALPAPQPRRVAIASINLRPSKTKDPVGDFLVKMKTAVPPATDLVVLPEGIPVVGTGKKYLDVSEPIPGPTTARLGEFARKRKAWIVAGIYEREGSALYNTAVLIDREGRVTGKYRKVYIPREEMEAGITAGSDYPVFQTDFGTIGMMICWDVQYADPARALALRGAELIVVPIWGGNETLGKARAIENRVFIAASGYDYPTYVMDPDGEMLARATDNGTVALATIDLNKRYRDKWLGDMRGRFMRELRLDVPVDVAGRR